MSAGVCICIGVYAAGDKHYNAFHTRALQSRTTRACDTAVTHCSLRTLFSRPSEMPDERCKIVTIQPLEPRVSTFTTNHTQRALRNQPHTPLKITTHLEMSSLYALCAVRLAYIRGIAQILQLARRVTRGNGRGSGIIQRIIALK